MEKYEKVLKLMQSKPDGLVRIDDADLKNLLGDRLVYRIPQYMSNIRLKAKLDVKGIRDNRKVVAYQLVATAAPIPSAPPAVVTSTPEPTSEEPGIAQPVTSESLVSESEPIDTGWSI